jgi:hypothetical protein
MRTAAMETAAGMKAFMMRHEAVMDKDPSMIAEPRSETDPEADHPAIRPSSVIRIWSIVRIRIV